MPKLTARDVRRQFKLYWLHCVRAKPELARDKPAKREAFSFYVDNLARSGEISERVAQNVTLD